MQEERLRKLQERLAVPFDGSRPEHQVPSDPPVLSTTHLM